MKSLLNKTSLHFIFCAAVVFFLAIPAFYLITKHFYAEDITDLIEATRNHQDITHFDLESDIMIGVTIQFVLIFIIMGFSLLITLIFINRRIWKPFDDTLNKIEQFNLEQNNEPSFQPTNIKEFDRLNKSATLLIQRNMESYRTQKEFTENASHELQTPLAIAQSKLDLLLQQNLNEQQSAIVSDLYKSILRMSRLNKNLLLLARIENAQYSQMEELDIIGFIEKQLPAYETLQNPKHTIILKTSEGIRPIIKANVILFESLLNNLVVNAIRHSNAESEVSILIERHSLTVCNETNNGPLDKILLFRRFHSYDKENRGNGLGLAIVKAICSFHKWTVDYNFKDNLHCFVVTFQRNVPKTKS